MPSALASALPPYVPAAIAVIGAGAAIAMANGWGRSAVRSALLATAWAITAGLVLAFTTEQVLILVGYLPIYLLGAPFGWAPDSFLDHVTWPVVHEVVGLLGCRAVGHDRGVVPPSQRRWRARPSRKPTFDAGIWAASAPVMLLPVWGVALGVAMLGYRRRRHIRATMQAPSSADQPRHDQEDADHER